MGAGRRLREEGLDLLGCEMVAERGEVALVVERDLVEGHSLRAVALAQVHHRDAFEERGPAERLEQGRAAPEGRLVGMENCILPVYCRSN